jgi:hypothetical protein
MKIEIGGGDTMVRVTPFTQDFSTNGFANRAKGDIMQYVAFHHAPWFSPAGCLIRNLTII